MIGLSLISEVLPQVKAENNVVSGNSSLLVKEGVALGHLANYTGAMSYFDKALVINPENIAALIGKGRTLNEFAAQIY